MFDKLREKIQNLIETRKEIVFGILFVVIVIFVVFYVFMTSRKRDEPGGLMQSPVSPSQDTDVSWDSVDMINADFPQDVGKMNSYSAQPYGLEEVKEILERLGFASIDPVVVGDEEFYTWTSGEDYASYFLVGGRFTLSSTGLRLEDLESQFIDQDSTAEYFQDFAAEYLGMGDEVNASVEVSGNELYLQGNFLIEGYDVVNSVEKEPTIIARFTEKGELLSVDLSLVRFELVEEVSVIRAAELKEYLRYNSFPKDLAYSVVAENEEECEGYECFLDLEGQMRNINISQASIVYYFNPMTPENVLPTYKLVGTGLMTDDEGKTHEVDVVVYANGVDPSLIRGISQ